MNFDPDPVINEVRAARHRISAEHGHDTRRIVAHYMKLDEELRKAGGHKFVTGFFATGPETPAAEAKH